MDGQPVDEIPLEKLVGPALLVRFSDDVRAIGEAELRRFDLGAHTRILLATRNSALLKKEDFTKDYTYLAPDGAEYLVGKGFELVGIDYLSIEQFRSGHHRTHKTLLLRSVVIVEGLDLSLPEPGEYQLVCLPLRLQGCDGAPGRAILIA
jgi:arylformamidase